MKFFTPQLNDIAKLFQLPEISKSVEIKINLEFQDIEANLLRQKILRTKQTSQVHYIIQSPIHEHDPNLAYLFSPLILSILGYHCIYSTINTPTVQQIMNRFGNIQYKLNIQQVMRNSRLYYDFYQNYYTTLDFLQHGLIKALSQPNLKYIYLICNASTIDTEVLQRLENFLNIKIILIKKDTFHDENIPLVEYIKLKQLFFKNKTDDYDDLCTQFSHKIANILQYCDHLDIKYQEQLINDLFYSEQIYECFSVYSEYIQTVIQNKKSFVDRNMILSL